MPTLIIIIFFFSFWFGFGGVCGVWGWGWFFDLEDGFVLLIKIGMENMLEFLKVWVFVGDDIFLFLEV